MTGTSPRSRSRRHRALLAAGLALVVAGCGANPENTAPAPVAAHASTTRDGVVVTVTASADTVTGGDTIRLHVSALNVGLDPVTWQSGGCGLIEWFGIEGPDIEPLPPGKVLPGVANLIKWAATSGGVGYASVRQPNLSPDVVMGCPANLAHDDIGPGETIGTDAIWPATTSDGVPLPPGRIRITYAFPFVARGGVAAHPPDANQNLDPIPVALPVTIQGDPVDAIPSTEAVDAALSDPRVADWIVRRVTKERLQGASILFVDGAWQLTIRVEPGRSTVVRVDPKTGHVDDVKLAD